MLANGMIVRGIQCIMEPKQKTEFKKWLMNAHSMYSDLASAAAKIIEGALRAEGIAFMAITHRTKTIESALVKARSKGYSQPHKEMTLRY